MKNTGGVKKFSAAANLTLIQHYLEKKMKIEYEFTIFFLGHLEQGNVKTITKTRTFKK